MPWIKDLILQECDEHDSLFDVFGGTGVVTAELLDVVKSAVINDFLFSNEVIYKAFFGKGRYSKRKLNSYLAEYRNITKDDLKDNYVSVNYGGKYFRYDDAKMIGQIRQDIEDKHSNGLINDREYCILIASLLYSFDRCANTVGHYEAYIKGKEIRNEFSFDLIEPIVTDKVIKIYRTDANELSKRIVTDIAFIDPPYNSRQYSRFYHVLETITKWDRPELVGSAMKPPEENMSDYCRNSAPAVFADLIDSIQAKYIVVTYNNTYDSKSSSSRNKIALEQIISILEAKGTTKLFEKPYHRFNAGKTDVVDHKEIVFITKVGK